MPVELVWLNFNRPGLAAAADYLIQRFGSPGALDLRDVVIVVAGARAGRRLEEILLQRAEQHRGKLQWPLIQTIGELPEQLYQRKRDFATELTQQFAWVKALQQTDPQQLKHLVPNVPAAADLLAWLALAATLARLHRELAAEALSFRDVADCLDRHVAFRDRQRWQTLTDIQARYLETLDGLGLWDRQTARLYAIRQAECQTAKQIVLLGLVDLNRSQRLMLDQLEGVTALVCAPEQLRDRFDDYGCVRSEAWQQTPIQLADAEIDVVGGPAEQADAVVRVLASWKGRYAAEQISIGVADERIVPYIEQRLKQCGIRTRYGAGIPLTQSSPYRLLQAVADHLESDRFATLAALVRHPELQRWLAEEQLEGDWLSVLDRYHAEHLPLRLNTQRLTRQGSRDTLGQLCRAIERLLGGLMQATSNSGHPLACWGEPIVALLVEIFGRRPLKRDDPHDRIVLAACEKIRQVLGQHAETPAELIPQALTPGEAIRMALREISGDSVAPLPDREAIELLGPLELPLDDAPALIFTGFNEGAIPKSANADPFLPDQLRRALGIEHNDRRYARDAYALSVLAAEREQLRVIAGRRTAEGDPLTPSRLLFACDATTAARRAKRFFGTPPSAAPAAKFFGTLQPGRSEAGFSPPRPQPLPAPVRSMQVTEFRDYLACPYRYYLKHRLTLEPLSDQREELDGAMFGALAHEVLRLFGQSGVRRASEAEAIFAFLSEQLDRLARQRFGNESLPAVHIQIEQLRRRFEAFARWQAQWTEKGWQIEYAEYGPAGEKAALEVDGQPMQLRGRIDRIDFHRAEGKRILFDYKSSDTLSTPEQTHLQQGQWVDLQLPLYWHLARRMGLGGDVKLGYIVLPKDPAKVGESLANWSEGELEAALARAAEVVRAVRAERFWPPTSPPPAFTEQFAAICGDRQFGAPAMEADAPGEPD